ncbi:MAG: RNA polymerase sigma factor [Flavobacteriaceae bacterium]|nr:RNA polymerase sigma factor [Flavobacteriaceae bacterium]
MKQLSDEELMHIVSQGNLDAMTYIFERYHKRLYFFYFQMVKDTDVCEDLTQNVFLKVIKYKHSYQGGKFVSWIFKIARNLFYDHYQEQKKTQDFESIEDVAGEMDEEKIEREEELSHLMKALSSLNEKDKELIVMNRLNGIKYEQIAEIVGSNTIAVKTKIHRIVQKLRTNYFETLAS